MDLFLGDKNVLKLTMMKLLHIWFKKKEMSCILYMTELYVCECTSINEIRISVFSLIPQASM